MKNLSVNYAAHIAQPVTTLAVCWRIVKANGEVIRGTDHDRDIVISATNIGMDLGSPALDLAGRYKAAAGITGSDIRSTADMSVDNMEVNGAIDTQISGDITVADMESGRLDGAPVTTFKVNWQDPDDFQDVLRHGFLGEVARTSDGMYTTEVRGLAQVLQQVVGRTAGDRCDVAEFGDHRCKFPVALHTVTGVVTAVTNRRQFSATLSADSPPATAGHYVNGKLTWTTGSNAGFTGQVKDDAAPTLGDLILWEQVYEDIQVGDEFTLAPGCDRRLETCRDRFNNIVNMRAPALYCPGMDDIIRAP
jgi:uncharacterized phage protein (TIGR02218 family)